jgi:FkbM family methyltransferase
MRLIRNFKTLIVTHEMPRQWLRWNLRSLGIFPCLKMPEDAQISGFRSFSEFWSVRAMVPAAEELAFMRRFAGKSGVLLDVGANLGCFSLTLARLRPSCIVHAFEPSPETLLRLKANVAMNKAHSVITHSLAIGKTIGRLQFVNDRSSPGTNRLLGQAEVAPSSTIEVEVSTIDRFLKLNGEPDVAFLKIDVEGFEADVLRGAAVTLTNHRCQAGLIELCPGNLHRVGSSVEELLDAVKQCGWRLHFLNQDGSLGSVVEAEGAETISLTNVAMLPSRSTP